MRVNTLFTYPGGGILLPEVSDWRDGDEHSRPEVRMKNGFAHVLTEAIFSEFLTALAEVHFSVPVRKDK